jgi:hypothetical protein
MNATREELEVKPINLTIYAIWVNAILRLRTGELHISDAGTYGYLMYSIERLHLIRI